MSCSFAGWKTIKAAAVVLAAVVAAEYKTNHHFVRRGSLTGSDKKLSYCWKTVRRESMPRIAEMDVEMTT